MNKTEFIDFISKQQSCTKVEAEKITSAFTQAVTAALAQKQEITLTGFGKFYRTEVEAREGKNPKTGQAMQIGAYSQAKFKAGQLLKDACNK